MNIFQLQMKVNNTTDFICISRTDNVKDVVNKFATKHNLTENKKTKLKILINETLKKYDFNKEN